MGPLVWMMYFLSAFSVIVPEPRLQVFRIPAVKWVCNLTIIATCAFSAFAPDLPRRAIWALVVGVIAVSVCSSGNLNVMKRLAILSTWGFGILVLVALVIVAHVCSGVGLTGLFANVGQVLNAFANIHRFASLITEDHEFHLFWWFAWSIMIGQFVADFVGGMKPWRLAFCRVMLPTIPLGLWCAVLYIYVQEAVVIPTWLNRAITSVGVVFVVKALDRLIRLYGSNLGRMVDRRGWKRYPPMELAHMRCAVADTRAA